MMKIPQVGKNRTKVSLGLVVLCMASIIAAAITREASIIGAVVPTAVTAIVAIMNFNGAERGDEE